MQVFFRIAGGEAGKRGVLSGDTGRWLPAGS